MGTRKAPLRRGFPALGPIRRKAQDDAFPDREWSRGGHEQRGSAPTSAPAAPEEGGRTGLRAARALVEGVRPPAAVMRGQAQRPRHSPCRPPLTCEGCRGHARRAPGGGPPRSNEGGARWHAAGRAPRGAPADARDALRPARGGGSRRGAEGRRAGGARRGRGRRLLRRGARGRRPLRPQVHPPRLGRRARPPDPRLGPPGDPVARPPPRAGAAPARGRQIRARSVARHQHARADRRRPRAHPARVRGAAGARGVRAGAGRPGGGTDERAGGGARA